MSAGCNCVPNPPLAVGDRREPVRWSDDPLVLAIVAATLALICSSFEALAEDAAPYDESGGAGIAPFVPALSLAATAAALALAWYNP